MSATSNWIVRWAPRAGLTVVYLAGIITLLAMAAIAIAVAAYLAAMIVVAATQ